LFEQLLDQRGTRNRDAKLMGKLQTDLEILEKDRHAHVRVRIEGARAAGLKVYDNRNVGASSGD
jgi:hypothetical protein